MRLDELELDRVHVRPASPHHAPWAGSAPAERRIAVLVPCFNEARTIASVVSGFRRVLPAARVYVYDNNSTDATAAMARDAGAIVRVEPRQGKGYVIRRMFADIEADCYILIDGDDTYDVSASAKAIDLVLEDHIDFVNIARRSTTADAYRRGHRFGNRVLTDMVRLFFGRQSTDMLSGYKVLSRRFVKCFPATSSGFETETELTVHALEMRMPMAEFPAPYRERPVGSTSKLRTYRDGLRILLLIGRLIKDERPMQFFGLIGILFIACGIAIGVPVVLTFFTTGLVPRLPTAVLSVGIVVLGWLSIFAGTILEVVTKARQEVKRMTYLSIPRFHDEMSPSLAAGRAGSGTFLRFCGVGACGFVVDAGVLMLAVHGAGLDPIVGRLVSFAAAVLTTFELNRRWTFSAERTAFYGRLLGAYLAVQGVGFLFNLGLYTALYLTLPRSLASPLACLVVSCALALAVNFFGTRFFVFRRSP